MKYLSFLTLLIVSNVAFATILGFNKTGGGTWNLTDSSIFDAPPTGNDIILIKTGGNTFTASEDSTCQGIYLTKSSITNTFLLDQDREISITASGTYPGVKVGTANDPIAGAGNNNPAFTHTTFSGGIWNLNETANFGPFYHYSYGKCTNTYVLTEGVIVTNVKTFAVGYNNIGHNVILEKGAKVYASGQHLMQGVCANCTFKMTSGSEYHAADYLSLSANGTSNIKILLSGEGTLLKVKKHYPYFCHGLSSNNVMIVEDNAKVEAPDFYYLCNANTTGSVNNACIIRNGGKLNIANTIYYATGYGITNNVFEISNGAVVETGAGKSLSWGGEKGLNNQLIISNATLRCERVYQERRKADNSIFRIIGKDSVYAPYYKSTLPLFGCGTGCVFSLEDGASWTYDHTLGFGYTDDHGSFNRVQLLRGSKLKANSFNVGYASQPITNCVIFVGDNSTLETVSDFPAYAANNSIVVSNGIVNVGGSMHWGRLQEGFLTTNNTIVLQGNKPKISIPNYSLQLRNYSKVRFEIPERGYLTDEPLIYASEMVVAQDPTVEITGLERFQKKLEETADITLFKIKGVKGDGSATVLPYSFRSYLSSIALPEGCSLTINNYEVILTVRATYNRTIILIK